MAAYLRAYQLVKVWRDVEEDSINGSGQSDPTEEQDEQHEVGIGGGEIHHLGRGWTVTELFRGRTQAKISDPQSDVWNLAAASFSRECEVL